MRSNNRRGRCHKVKRKTNSGSGKGVNRGGYVSRLPKNGKEEE